MMLQILLLLLLYLLQFGYFFYICSFYFGYISYIKYHLSQSQSKLQSQSVPVPVTYLIILLMESMKVWSLLGKEFHTIGPGPEVTVFHNVPLSLSVSVIYIFA